MSTDLHFNMNLKILVLLVHHQMNLNRLNRAGCNMTSNVLKVHPVCHQHLVSVQVFLRKMISFIQGSDAFQGMNLGSRRSVAEL